MVVAVGDERGQRVLQVMRMLKNRDFVGQVCWRWRSCVLDCSTGGDIEEGPFHLQVGARSTRRQGSVGEVWAAQVWNHQEGVPRVRRSLKESAVLGPSHFGEIVARLLESVPGGLRAPLRLWRRHKGEGG